jgi:soluble lytic murein transglycosylase
MPLQARPLSPHDRQVYTQAFALANKDRWGQAEQIATKAADPLLAKVLHWGKLRYDDAGVTFADITQFLAQNPTWPHQEGMIEKAEKLITDSTPQEALRAWFAQNPPKTTTGRMAWLRILLTDKKITEAQQLAQKMWIENDFNASNETDFLRNYGGFLTPQNHLARLDMLLWEGDYTQVYRLKRFLPQGAIALADAQHLLNKRANGAAAAVDRVPAPYNTNTGLLYEYANFARLKGDDKTAIAALLRAKTPVLEPKLWWKEVEFQARKTLRLGDAKTAYAIARNNQLSAGSPEYLEAEFLAGWIANTFLKQPKLAAQHFLNVYKNSQTPVSRARGGYWLAQTAEAVGKTDISTKLYTDAAQYYSSFYGQLAMQKINADPFTMLTNAVPPAGGGALINNPLALSIVQLNSLGERRFVGIYANALLESVNDPAEVAGLTQLLTSIGRIDLALTMAKKAKNLGLSLPDAEFPMLKLPSAVKAPEAALVFGIIRQESLFNVSVQSPVGARGLMQLMPETAKIETRVMRISYNLPALTRDGQYNMLVGSHHLKRLIEQFNGSYPLVAAAYNAGGGNVKKWLAQYGDPRTGEISMIDWIESIPFRETRNYVQRVLEGVEMYRLRLQTLPHFNTTMQPPSYAWCAASCTLLSPATTQLVQNTRNYTDRP